MAMHAPTPGFKRTLCGRRSGSTTVYQKQVTCRRCVGGLRKRPEDSPLRCIHCCGEGWLTDASKCGKCDGRGTPLPDEVKDWAGAIVPEKKGAKEKKGSSHGE